MLLTLWMVFSFAGIQSDANAVVQSEIQFDANVSQSLKNQVNGDFGFVQGIQGSSQSPFHQEIFGDVNGGNYVNWFTSRVQFFGVSDCGGPSAVACVNSVPRKIWVTSNYINGNYPQVARVMTIFHEARHTEDKVWPHAKCPGNFPYRSIWTGSRLRNNHACDRTVYGSYGSATIMLNNLSKFCANCSEKTKLDATIYSDDQSKRIIDANASLTLKRDFAWE